MAGEAYDTRIVEMHFENRQFERNIAKSQKSLEDFKKELDFDKTSKGLRDFGSSINSIDFSNLAVNIQRLTDKFTGLGDAGEWVMSRIRNGIESAALKMEGFLKTFTLGQVQVGQNKYDAMNKAVQTLIATGEYTEEQAYTVFGRVQEYTDQTSASFETMVAQISQFTAVGEDLWDSEKAMEGIFNMTMKAGKSAQEASIAMNIFSKAMGSGHLTYENWISLNQSAHITTKELREQMLEAAVATGQLTKKGDKYYAKKKKQNGKAAKDAKKAKDDMSGMVEVTADNLESTLAQGWMDKKTMMHLFQAYYFEKLTGATEEELESFSGTAYKSAQKALTFADAMTAIKESISTGWMDSFRIIFGDVTEAMELFTNLCERVIESIEGLKEARNDMLRAWSSSGGRQALIDTILGDYGKDVETGAYGLLDLFDEIGTVISNGFWNMVKIFAKGDDLANWDDEGFKEAWFGKKLADVTGNIRDFVKSFKSFFTEEIKVGDKTKTRLQMIQDIVDGIGAALVLGGLILNGVFEFIGGIKQQLQPSLDAIVDFFSKLGKMLYDTAVDAENTDSISASIKELLESLKPLTGAINKIVIRFADMSMKFLEWGKNSGIFSKAGEVLKRVFELLGRVLDKVGLPILDFFGDLVKIFMDLFDAGFAPDAIKSVGGKLRDALDKLVKSIIGEKKLESIKETITSIFHKVFSVVGNLIPEPLKNIFGNLFGTWNQEVTRSGSGSGGGGAPGGLGTVFNIFNNIKDGFLKGYKQVKDSFKNINLNELLIKVNGFIQKFKPLILSILGIFTAFEGFRLVKNARKTVQSFNETMGTINTVIENKFIKPEKNTFKNVAQGILMITIAILGIVWAMQMLGTMDQKVLIQGGIAVGVAMVAIGLMAFALSKVKLPDWKVLMAIALMTMVLGLTIKTLAKAMGIIGKMDWDVWLKAFITMVALFGFLAIVIIAAEKMPGTKQAVENVKAVVDLIKMVPKVLIGMIPMAALPWESLAKIGASLLGLFVILTLFVLATHKISKGEKNGQLAPLGKLLEGVGSLIAQLLPLALLDWVALGKMGAGLGVLLLAIAGFAWAMKKIGNNSKGAKLSEISDLAEAIQALLLRLLPLALLKWEALGKMGAGLGVLLVALLGFTWAMKKIGPSEAQLTGLTGLAAGLAILIIAMLPLSRMPWDQLKQGLIGLVTMVGILAIFLLAVKATSLGSGILKQIFMILTIVIAAAAIAVVMYAFVKAVDKVKNIKPEVMRSFAESIAIVMLSMAGVLAILSLIPLAAGLKAVVIFAAFIAALALVLSVVLPILINSLGGSLVNFSANMSLLASLVTSFSDKMNGVNEGGIDKAEQIFGRLHTMFGQLAGFGKYQQDIRTFSTALFDLSTGLESYQYHTMNLQDPAGSNGFKMIDGILKYKDSFGSFSVGQFPSEIYRLAIGLYMFDYVSDEMHNPSESKPLQLIQALAGCAQDIQLLSTIGLDTLKGQLAGLGGAMVIYAEGAKEITGIKGDQTATAQAAVGVLKAITTELAKEGGFTIPEIPKESELGTFGADLAALAVAVTKFVEASSGMGQGTSMAIAMLDFLVNDLKPKLTKQNLEATKAFRESGITPYGLAEFALDITALGVSIGSFVDSTKGCTEQSFKNALSALGFFAELRGKLVAEDAVVACINYFTGQNITNDQLVAFGKDIEALGSALAKFAKSVTWDGDTDKAFKNALSSLDFLVKLKNRLPRVEGLAQLIAGRKETLGELGSELLALGEALKEFGPALLDEDGNPIVNETTTSAIVAAINPIVDLMSKMQTELQPVDGLLTGLAEVLGGRPYSFKDLKKDITYLGSVCQELLRIQSYLIDDEGKPLIDAANVQYYIGILNDLVAFMTGLRTKMGEVGGLWPGIKEALSGRPYKLSDLKKDVREFGNTCNALLAVNGKLLNAEGKPIVNSETITSTMGILDSFVDFQTKLKEKVGPVGGLFQEFVGLFTGKDYTVEQLTADVTKFGDSCAELVRISDVLTDDEGGPIISQDAVNLAMTMISTIISYITRLKNQMPKVGGLLNDLDSLFRGKDYDSTLLQEDISRFKTICEDLRSISVALVGEDGKTKIIEPGDLEPAIALIDAIRTTIVTLTTKMPGVPTDMTGLHNSMQAQPYTIGQIATDIGYFSSICTDLRSITTALLGENGSTPLIKSEEMTPAIELIDSILAFIADLQTKMPQVGGDVSDLHKAVDAKKYSVEDLKTDVSNFTTVCQELPKIANAVKDKNGKPIIDQALISTTTTILGDIAGFAKQLGTDMPNVGGFIPALTGSLFGESFKITDLQNNIGDFGDVCTELGTLGTTLTGETMPDSNKLNEAIGLGTTIASFARQLSTDMDTVGGAVPQIQSAFTGKAYTLEDLQGAVGTFREICGQLVEVSKILNGEEGENPVDSTKIDAATSSLSILVRFMQQMKEDLPSVGGIAGFINNVLHGDYTMEQLKTDLGNLGGALNAFGTELGTDFNAGQVGPAIEIAKGVVDLLSIFAELFDQDSFVWKFSSGYEEVSSVLVGWYNDFTETQWSGMAGSLARMMHEISTSMDEIGGINPANISVFATLAEGLKHLTEVDPTFSFEPVGTAIAQGIANGLHNSQSIVTEEAKKLATATYDATMETLKAHSPSRLFMEVGGFITSGLAIGMDKGSSEVGDSAQSMSEDALDGAMSVLRLIGQNMDDELDPNPVITPVLDLTDIENGVGTLDGMFANRGLNLHAALSSAYIPDRTTPEINQNGSDYSGIYDRMRDLQEQLRELGTDISKMKLVLDTGSLVGGVAPGVDSYIGRQTFYGRRGN